MQCVERLCVPFPIPICMLPSAIHIPVFHIHTPVFCICSVMHPLPFPCLLIHLLWPKMWLSYHHYTPMTPALYEYNPLHPRVVLPPLDSLLSLKASSASFPLSMSIVMRFLSCELSFRVVWQRPLYCWFVMQLPVCLLVYVWPTCQLSLQWVNGSISLYDLSLDLSHSQPEVPESVNVSLYASFCVISCSKYCTLYAK